jgi:hypothetical protein
MFDATDTTRTLVDVIADLEQRFAGMSDRERVAELQTLGFTKKTIALMNTLLGTSESIRAFTTELEGAAGTARDVASKQLPPLTAAWEKLKAVMTRWSVTNIAPVMADLGEGMSLLLDATRDLNEASENLKGSGDNFKTVDFELEGMAAWVGKAADAWDRVAVALKVVESGVYAVLTGTAELLNILTLLQFESLGKLAEGWAEDSVAAWDKAMAKAEDTLVDPRSQRMLREKAERDLQRHREQKAKEAAAGGVPAPGQTAAAFAPTLTTQAGASGILRGQDASTVTLESQQGKLGTFLKEWLTDDSRKKLAEDVAQTVGEGLKKAAAVAGGAAFSGPLEAQMSKARTIFDQTRTPLEKFNTQMEELKTLLDVGAFAGMGGEETYRRAVEQAQEAYKKASGKTEAPGPPALARMGGQEAYELVRQNRMGDTRQVAPMVKEQRETNMSLTELNASMDELVSEMREQTDALQGMELSW